MTKRELLIAAALAVLIAGAFFAGIDFIGMLGALFAFTLFLPQAFKAWRLRNDVEAMSGLSLIGFVMLLANSTVWVLYGIGLSALWIIVPNSLNVPVSLFMLGLIIRSRRRDLHVSR